MPKYKLITTILLAACLALTLPNPHLVAQEQPVANYNLAPKWTTGQTSRYKTTSTKLSTIVIEQLNRTVEQKLVSNAIIKWTVTQANPDGGGTAEMVIETMSMSMTGPDGKTVEVNKDATEPRFANAVKVINAIIGSPLKVNIDTTGTVTGVEGYEAIRAKAEVEKENTLDETEFKETAVDLAVLSGGAPNRKPGDTWTTTNTWNHQMGKLTYNNTYTLAGVEKLADIPVAMINAEAKIDFQLVIPEQPEGAPEVSVEMTQAAQNAQLMFDLSRNELVGVNTNKTLAFKSTMTLGPRTINQNITEKINSQIIRIAEE